jgi:hypothetical protein
MPLPRINRIALARRGDAATVARRPRPVGTSQADIRGMTGGAKGHAGRDDAGGGAFHQCSTRMPPARTGLAAGAVAPRSPGMPPAVAVPRRACAKVAGSGPSAPIDAADIGARPAARIARRGRTAS